MKNLYSKYLNKLDLVNLGYKRIFIIFHISLFLISTYWFYWKYLPSDFNIFFDLSVADCYFDESSKRSKWIRDFVCPSLDYYNRWRIIYYSEGFIWQDLFYQLGRIIIASISLFCFNFGFPYLIHLIFNFPKKVGIFNEKLLLIIYLIKSILFIFLFRLLWFHYEYEPFKMDSLFDSLLIYHLLLVFIPLSICFFITELILFLFIWVKDGFGKN